MPWPGRWAFGAAFAATVSLMAGGLFTAAARDLTGETNVAPGPSGDIAEAVAFTAEVMTPDMEMVTGYEALTEEYDPNTAVGFLLSRRIVPGLPMDAYPLADSVPAPAFPENEVYSPLPSSQRADEVALTYSGLLGVVAEAAKESGLPPSLIDAVIQTESSYRVRAVSESGALGLMQLMPGTAEALGVTDPFDPRQNVLAGSLYLRSLFDRFGSLRLALAAYNAGPSLVERVGGVPPIPETRAYVESVLARYQSSDLR